MSGKHNLYQRSGIWWFKKTHQGKTIRQSLETKSLKQAQQRRDMILRDISDGKWGETSAKTFNEAVDRWIDTHLGSLKPKSVTRYKVSLVHLLEEFDGLDLKHITSSRLSDFEARRRKSGASNPTIRRDFACLSSLLTHCEDWEWIEGNEAMKYLRRRKRRGLRENPPKTRYLSIIEERELLAESDTGLYRAVAFAIDTGLRKEEQFSLLKSDVDLEKKIVRIRREIAKSSVARSVPLLPRSMDIVKDLLEEFEGPYLFAKPDGSRYANSSKTFYMRMQKAAKRSKLERFSWHDLRRTCGCRLLNEYDMEMHKVSAWLGHSSVDVTEKTYAFLEQEKLSEAVKKRA